LWILINGERQEFAGGLSLSELIEKLELPVTRIAIELNREVVRRADWTGRELQNEDRVEIVHFVGGGVN
jgi:sulfur carrier protein